MEWVQFIIFFIGVFGLFVWNRTEARTDSRHVENIIQADRNLMMSIREEGIQYREELRTFREQMNNETKEFHQHLLEIERNRR
jgi:uncharacterized membrane protein YccC